MGWISDVKATNVGCYGSLIDKVQDASGDKFNLKPKDGLYSALLHAKNNPLEQSQEMEQSTAEEESLGEEEETDYSMSR